MTRGAGYSRRDGDSAVVDVAAVEALLEERTMLRRSPAEVPMCPPMTPETPTRLLRAARGATGADTSGWAALWCLPEAADCMPPPLTAQAPRPRL